MRDKDRRASGLIESYARIYEGAEHTACGDRCLVAPSPELQKKLKQELESIRADASPSVARLLKAREKNRVGFNDGLVFPGSYFPVGTPAHRVRSVSSQRAPLSGTLHVVVVLVDFDDEGFSTSHDQQHYEDLFFSTGVLADGSVREYFDDVTGGLVQITGEVVGPYRMPQDLADYANGQSGIGSTTPNARDMAEDAAAAANPDVNFSLYDNDGDGFVDAFIVLQAGPAGESTGSGDHIWSHKWVMRSVFNADGTSIYAYLTVPEEARIGVCCHELGHLLFGFPDLYDTDYSSSGVGNWCLMGGGSWNGGGDVPAHPSAWCKANQNWVTVINQTSNAVESIADVKDSRAVYRLWKDGAAGDEYFLVENRQRNGYDQFIPSDGLLIWHIDDAVSSNANETHPKVALEQADGLKDLEAGNNRGDGGDPYPGSTNNVAFNKDSTPSSRSYGDADTCVAVDQIGASGAVMSARLKVKCAEIKRFEKLRWKEYNKDYRKDSFKEFRKENFKEYKEKEHKEWKEGKEWKEKEFEWPGGGAGMPGPGAEGAYGAAPPGPSVEARLDAIEQQLGIDPFIHGDLRPDMAGSALSQEGDVARLRRDMQENAARARKDRATRLAMAGKKPKKATKKKAAKKRRTKKKS